MCLIVLAWKVHPIYRMVVAANRDEFFARPTAPAAFWADTPQVLAGRDLEAGGTWLGVSRSQRFAALTNFREGGRQIAGARSRGALVTDFLLGDETPLAYLKRVASSSTAYNGFNLIAADSRELAYYANRGGGQPVALLPGIYGMSNHLLDTPWPKLAAAKAAVAGALAQLPDPEPFFQVLADQDMVPDENLPETGVALAWERVLSAVFVRSPTYGTRASTLLTCDHRGTVQLIERSFAADARFIGEQSETFQSSAMSTEV